MSRVITFSREFPAYHPKAKTPTFFVEKILRGIHVLDDHTKKIMDMDVWSTCDPKHHTIRAGKLWSVGDKFSPRIWGDDINPKSGGSGPYQSKQIIIAPDIEVKKTWDFAIINGSIYFKGYELNGETEGAHEKIEEIAMNDGLSKRDLIDWFFLSPEYKKAKSFSGQVICWNENINY